MTIGACILLAVSVPVLLWCAVQYFTAGPPIPEGMNCGTGPVADCEAIIGYADTLTAIYVANKFPTWLFLSAVSLFAVGIGVLLALKIKRWKGKTLDGQD